MDIDDDPSLPGNETSSTTRSKGTLTPELPAERDASSTLEEAHTNMSELARLKRGHDTFGADIISPPMALRKDNIPGGSNKLTLEEYRAKRAKIIPSSSSNGNWSSISRTSSSSLPSAKPKVGLFIPKAKRPTDRVSDLHLHL
jgi:hypothetical protein